MKKIFKPLLALAFVLTISVGILAGCGGGADPKDALNALGILKENLNMDFTPAVTDFELEVLSEVTNPETNEKLTTSGLVKSTGTGESLRMYGKMHINAVAEQNIEVYVAKINGYWTNINIDSDPTKSSYQLYTENYTSSEQVNLDYNDMTYKMITLLDTALPLENVESKYIKAVKTDDIYTMNISIKEKELEFNMTAKYSTSFCYEYSAVFKMNEVEMVKLSFKTKTEGVTITLPDITSMENATLTEAKQKLTAMKNSFEDVTLPQPEYSTITSTNISPSQTETATVKTQGTGDDFKCEGTMADRHFIIAKVENTWKMFETVSTSGTEVKTVSNLTEDEVKNYYPRNASLAFITTQALDMINSYTGANITAYLDILSNEYNIIIDDTTNNVELKVTLNQNNPTYVKMVSSNTNFEGIIDFETPVTITVPNIADYTPAV